MVKLAIGTSIQYLQRSHCEVSETTPNMNKQSISSVLLAGLVIAGTGFVLAEPGRVRVLVWDEQQPVQKQAYGGAFLGETIAAQLASVAGFEVKNTNLQARGQGLEDATLDATDVLIWWGHVQHSAVSDENAERVARRVREGRLGLLALHSAHWAKPFVRLMQERAKADALALVPEAERDTAKWKIINDSPIGRAVRRDAPMTPALESKDGVWCLTLPSCVFPAYRPDGAPSHVATLLPRHPIADGLPASWRIEQTEMYDEPFHVPEPDAVVFEERWDKGERFRSGCVWTIGKGRVFYFRPGHETYPVFRQPQPLKVIENAVRWLTPNFHQTGASVDGHPALPVP